MEFVERALGFVEACHRRLSSFCLKVVGALWALQGRRSLSFRLAVGFFPLVLVAVWCAYLVSGGYVAAKEFDESLVRYLESAGHLAAGVRLAWALLAAAALSLAAMVSALAKKRFSFRLMQAAWASFAATAALALVWLMRVGSIFVACDHKAFDSGMRNELWTGLLFWGLVAALWTLALLVALLMKGVRRAYGFGDEPLTRDAGERVVAAAKTTVGDRRWKSSLYYAFTIFFLVIFGPYLVFMWGWEEPYGLPKGGGEQVFEQVQVKKIKRKKPKKLTVNPWSPYILERMDIDDVVTLKELEEETKDTYAAQNSSQKGGKGKGSGGWPKGMDGSAVRFIRLKYNGGDWDQDMGKGSDYNLLVKFHKITGFPIWKETESRPISRLSKFPKHYAPPFVFLTGSRGINVSNSDIAELRKYLVDEGGMLFIDNGGGNFGGAVRSLVSRIFPDKPFIDIPNDDPIYQQPYSFPDGAPPFWHHDGSRARGIRIGDRLAVFYHPGDINDAWKDGHSGASEAVAEQAFKLGINVMYYAFNAYYARHFEGATSGDQK